MQVSYKVAEKVPAQYSQHLIHDQEIGLTHTVTHKTESMLCTFELFVEQHSTHNRYKQTVGKQNKGPDQGYPIKRELCNLNQALWRY